MFIDEKVKDIMVPLESYAVCKENLTLQDAILSLRQVYCEVETGECTEAGHRALLIVNDSGELVGLLDFPHILRVLVPEIAGSLSDKLMQLGASIAFAEANVEDASDESKLSFEQKVQKNAHIAVKDVMLKSKGQIDSEAILFVRYFNRSWVNLTTYYVKNDTNYSYYLAETPGFSTFAVVGAQVVEIQPYGSVFPEIPWLVIIGLIICATIVLVIILFKGKYIYREEDSSSKKTLETNRKSKKK